MFNIIKVATLALLFSFGLNYAYAWTPPTVTPPDGNVTAPISTSASNQTKTGGLLSVFNLWVDQGLGVTGGGSFGGSVGIGTTNPGVYKLNVNGTVNSTGLYVSGVQKNTVWDAKEPAITAGTTGQYWRGDKTWQTLPSGGAVTSVFGRTGAVVAQTGDYTATNVGLGNVTNESKATMFSSPTFTGTVSGITKAMVALGSVDNTADTAKPVSTAQQTELNLKANIASPTFTGTVSGITKAMVALGSVDNTADTAKPVSTAQQTALNLKANIASPTFTGSVTMPGTGIWNSTGTVGIGTATPNGRLDVRATNSGASQELINTFNSNGSYLTSLGATPTGDGYLTLVHPTPPGTSGVGNVRLDSNGVSYFNGGNVGIGVGSAASQKLEVAGGIRLNTTTARPVCSSTVRGTFWYIQSASGVKDVVAVCAKDALNTFQWRAIY